VGGLTHRQTTVGPGVSVRHSSLAGKLDAADNFCEGRFSMCASFHVIPRSFFVLPETMSGLSILGKPTLKQA
jgi:hypothetical protein